MSSGALFHRFLHILILILIKQQDEGVSKIIGA